MAHPPLFHCFEVLLTQHTHLGLSRRSLEYFKAYAGMKRTTTYTGATIQKDLPLLAFHSWPFEPHPCEFYSPESASFLQYQAFVRCPDRMTLVSLERPSHHTASLRRLSLAQEGHSPFYRLTSSPP